MSTAANNNDDAGDFEPIDIDDSVIEREFEIMHNRRKWPPLARRVEESWVIDLFDIEHFHRTPPHRKILNMVLMLAVINRASEIYFVPWTTDETGISQTGFGMFYEVNGQLHELVPPPDWFAKSLFRDLKTVAGLNTLRHRIADLLRRLASRIDGQLPAPQQGRFGLNCDGANVDVQVRVYDSGWGDRYFLTLLPSPEAVTDDTVEKIQQHLSMLMELIGMRTFK